jgi:rubrerythrin
MASLDVEREEADFVKGSLSLRTRQDKGTGMGQGRFSTASATQASKSHVRERDLVPQPVSLELDLGGIVVWVCRLCHYINSNFRCRICGAHR